VGRAEAELADTVPRGGYAKGAIDRIAGARYLGRSRSRGRTLCTVAA
jgi:hypothetical protein